MADKIIKDPILNRPYDEPTRHFEFDVDGITDRIAERRRPSSYFVPVPRSARVAGNCSRSNCSTGRSNATVPTPAPYGAPSCPTTPYLRTPHLVAPKSRSGTGVI